MRTESTIHRHLEQKFKVWGMEASDLLLSVGLFALMSMIFGGTFLEIPMSIILPVLLLSALTYTKRNQPERHLIHLYRYYICKGYFSCHEGKDLFQ